ncbi:dihydrolipoamide acetyltransferase family protein [Alicyclobacillus mengziensis]|uniref:Dihydrolipoamide acetyltransferase component of pyruvate dehydrogenase complex n=1 Tax=Alicyclobacillus mengziensis TaxID=2931921 RepID=A0A9X7Z4X3_9BACL|nr:dihydrolipoamide acetyltransferase family protein [Alicyclobacillus mengziensis]QSO45797.1 2-oxo acid dehydrogenase subunit E2 [Alicyclobacillus mengziensis]
MPDVKMPQLGESVTEGTIGKWLKSVGDPVSKYEPIAEVITDKVTAEVPSDFDGVMEELLIGEGDTVAVGTVICKIAADGDAVLEMQDSARPQNVESEFNSSTPNQGDAMLETPARPVSESPVVDADSLTHDSALPRGRYSPAVLRLADEHGVDLNLLRGTGEGGRITRKDVLTYVARRTDDGGVGEEKPRDGSMASEQERQTLASGQTSADTNHPADAAGTGTAAAGPVSLDEEWITPSPIRKTIAKRMVESKQTAPHAWTMVEADVTSLVNFRNHVKGDFKRKEGIDLTYLPFFIKAVAEALKRYPIMNASWIDEKIIMHRRINISIAVATDDVLVVPVIQDADRLSVAGLAHSVNELAAKARSGRLLMSDVQGGTFTVNNTGAFGSVLSQPILNAPQAGILSVESIVKRPVVVQNDAIAVRSMVNLCLSLDHRVLDGWVAGQFLRAVRERLESFDHQTVLY